MSILIEKAKQIESSLKLDELLKHGFKKEIKGKADSHQTVTYPEKKHSCSVSPEEIFYHHTENKDLSLYLHIPFCNTKCVYCQYTSFYEQSDEKIATYISALKKEIDLASELPEIKNSKITSVYIGGGTPTYLSPSDLEDLLKHIQKKFNLTKNIEFTVESTPETILGGIGKEKLEILRKYGGNRLSIGIQTFDNDILHSMNRKHNLEQALSSIETAKEKFDNLNIDLIFGFPDQTLEAWESDLNIIANMKIPPITIYPLTIKLEAAIYNLFEKNPKIFLDEKSYLLMDIMAIEIFKEMRFKNYPVWWFASSPKYIYKQQIHKWENNGELLALGISGYSYLNSWQYYNFRTMKEYFDSLNNNRLPIQKGIKLRTKKRQAIRNMVFGIKCKIDKCRFKGRYGFNPEEEFGKPISKLENLGLIKNTEKEIKLTYKGKLFAEEVSRYFIKKL